MKDQHVTFSSSAEETNIQSINEGEDEFTSLISKQNTSSQLIKKKMYVETEGQYDYIRLKLLIFSAVIASAGGFLFGYDISLVAGCNLFFHHTFEISEEVKDKIVSISLIGAAIGSLSTGVFSDKYGRKITIILADAFLLAGYLTVFFSHKISFIMKGRLLVGIGLGTNAMIIPVYLAEISPSAIRGRIVQMSEIGIVLGQIVSYTLFIIVEKKWRYMVLFGIIVCAIQFISMFFLYESPRWLFKQRKIEKTKEVLNQIYNVNSERGREEVQNEIEFFEEFNKTDIEFGYCQKLAQLFTKYRKILFLGCMLQLFQQLGGVDTLMYYGPEILYQNGFHFSKQSNKEIQSLFAGLLISLITGIGAIIALLFIDKLGRRLIILTTIPVCALAMLSIGIGLWTEQQEGHLILGQWMTAISMAIYFGFFPIGMESVPWIVNSEIYPLHLRGMGISIATTVNWVTNYMVSSQFLSQTTDDTGKVVVFVVIALFCVGSEIFCYFWLVETNGKSLEEIQDLILNPQKELDPNNNLNKQE